MTPLSTKPHYPILDGLRGVAALSVVAMHIFEAHSTSHQDMIVNHGYLAVDFFFLLSGYVIGYAYDDRWGKMTIGEFFKRPIDRRQAVGDELEINLPRQTRRRAGWIEPDAI